MPATDYTQRLDAEVLVFIDQVNAWYPPEVAALPIHESRAVYNRMCRAFHAGHPGGVRSETSEIACAQGAIPIRSYRHEDAAVNATEGTPLVLYFHGGGFVLGDLDSHDDICAEICGHTRATVVSVGYRLAPEHLHPAAFDDAVAAYTWATRTHPARIILVGESAGGNLAACLALRLRHHATPPAGLVLVYPVLGGDATQGSYLRHANAPLLSTQDVAAYAAIRTGGVDASTDVRCTPLAASNYAGLPNTFIATAECDPLSSDGEALRNRIVAAGGIAEWQEEAGLVHGYLRARHQSTRAGQAFARVLDAITRLAALQA